MRVIVKRAAPMAALVLLTGVLVAAPAGAGSGAASCVVAADTTSTLNGVPTPRPLQTPAGDWGTTSTITWVCAGSVSGVVLNDPGVTNYNVPHCNTAQPGGEAVGHATATQDNVAWTALCLEPIAGLRPFHTFGTANSVSGLNGGVSCTWDTNGHGKYSLTGALVMNLEMDNFTCTNGFGGPGTVGRSPITGQAFLNPLLSPPFGTCAPAPCWLHAYSVGGRLFVKAS